ncbi:hypothetical protein [Ruania albidiflava]|uniref:hypothetical protein n=1 Tax=Ruania albidiflava TaxID=366586 RepID=UPI0003B49871|nr:hypothetical protein [Ruania albidiflava]
MRAELLTVGPRGRRLCLDLACRLDHVLSYAAFDRGYELDPGKGTSVQRLMAFPPGTTQEEMDAARATEDARPVPRVAEIAGLLTQVPLPAAGPSQVHVAEALADSVATAMYWQPPDGQDVLAGHGELDDGLARVAAWLAPHAPDWWTAPMADHQWALGWWGHDPGERSGSVTEWRDRALAEEERSARMRRENRVDYPGEGWSPTPGLRPADVDAPISGTWWSFPDGVQSTRAVEGVPLGLDLTEDAGGAEDVQVAAVQSRAGARVLEIDDPQVWVDLCRAHPLEVTCSRRHDWYRVTGRDGRWVVPDWAAVAETYDAVHLTTAAYLAGATRALAVDAETATMIAGWGPDATQWLTPVQIGPAHSRGYDQRAEAWVAR